jgi:hypothetical protein
MDDEKKMLREKPCEIKSQVLESLRIEANVECPKKGKIVGTVG